MATQNPDIMQKGNRFSQFPIFAGATIVGDSRRTDFKHADL